jgi:hypothetical protein
VATEETHTELVASLAVSPWTGEYGQRFIGVLCGVLNDLLTEGASVAAKSPLIYPVTPRTEDYEQPIEALDLLGRDCMLLRYAGESHYQALRARLRDKWSFWQQGIKPALLAELDAAGYSGVEIYVPNDFTPRPDPVEYWSRFWLLFPEGTHPVTSPTGFVMGTSVVGTDYIGPVGLDSPEGSVYLELLKSIVRRMKPAQWVCWDIIFEIEAGVEYVHLQFRPRFDDALYEYENDGADFPL